MTSHLCHEKNWLIAKEISFVIDNKTLINNVSLSLACGEFIAMIGPNGAGKSTLMRMLTGFLLPTHGRVEVQSKPIQLYPNQKLAMMRSVMQQHIQVNVNFSVIDIIMLGNMNHSIGNGLLPPKNVKNNMVIDDALTEIIELTECQALLNRNMQTLSGGEQQRVHLARTLYQIWPYTEQGVGLFLDEPTSALDLYYQQHLLRLLRTITKNKKIAVCAILHDVNLAALYADRLVVLTKGVIRIDDSPQKVLTHPNFLDLFGIDGGITHHTEQIHVPQIYLKY